MLPRTRGPLMRPMRSRGVPLPFLLAAVMGIPLVLWLFLLHPAAKPEGVPTQRLLDKLKQQGFADTEEGTPVHLQAAGQGQYAGAQNPLPETATRFNWVSSEQIAAAGKYLQEGVLTYRQRPAVAPSKYIIEPEPHDMRTQHKKVAAYLKSSAFKSKVAARQASKQRGIIINAGAPNLIASTIVSLKVLREVLNCSLPIELVWHSTAEMDSATLAELHRRWGPIIGVNLSSMPWPGHHRPQDLASWNQSKFLGKVQSLTTSSFATALLLDADNMPLANPEGLWDDASFKATGNLFWPDFWVSPATSEYLDIVYDMVGLKHMEAEAVLSAGKGRLKRDTESGQLLLDLVRHADVAEWALWINSFGDTIYNAVWGDKDTYGLAFAVAGKAHLFNQLQVPPGAALTWRPDKLLVKATAEKQPGWQLAGMVQFDARGQPAFLHRTMNKFSWTGDAWHLGLITGPLPLRWIHYYLLQEAQGPTVGVPYDYVAPDSAFVQWRIPSPADTATAQSDGWTRQLEEACPAATFTTYWRLREHAVPLGASSTLDRTCAPLLQTLLGTNIQPYRSAQVIQHPELLALGLTDFDQVVFKRVAPNPLVPASEVPDATPVLAWVPDYMAPAVETTVSSALRASYEAILWLQQHADAFPLLSSAAGLHLPQKQNQQQKLLETEAVGEQPT